MYCIYFSENVGWNVFPPPLFFLAQYSSFKKKKTKTNNNPQQNIVLNVNCHDWWQVDL